jgi:hypothetical protein
MAVQAGARASVEADLASLIAANPWPELPTDPPFVLPGDSVAPDLFHTELPPCPWSGPALTARVLLLMRNPSYVPSYRRDLESNEFRRLYRAQLSGLAPFPWLDRRWAHSSDGGGYWTKLLRRVAEDVGPATVASAFATVQWSAYFSTTWPNGSAGPAASQAYAARVVRFAIDRGALVIICRARSDWLRLVPELEPHEASGAVIVMPHPHLEPYLTPGMVGPGYQALIAALAGGSG